MLGLRDHPNPINVYINTSVNMNTITLVNMNPISKLFVSFFCHNVNILFISGLLIVY